MNNWQLLLAGTAAGTVKGDLQTARNRKLSFALSGPSQLTFDLPGDHPQALQMAELQTDVYATCNGEWMFKGRVGASSDALDATNHTSSFTATDYRGMLARRILWPTSTLNFTNLEQAEIAWRLIADTQLLSDLVIWRYDLGGADTLVPTGVTRTMVFNPGQKVDEAIQLIAQQQQGFDWDVSGNGQFRLFYPSRDRYASSGSPTLAYGREVVACQRQLASATFANAIYMTGDSATFPVSVVSSDTATYGRFESSIGKTDVKDQASLQLAAGLELMVDDKLTATYSFVLAPGAFNPDLVWLGDSVHFFVAAGRLTVDLVARVTGIDIALDDGGGEQVTLTIGQTPSWITSAAGAGGGSSGVVAPIAIPDVGTITPPPTAPPGAFSLPNTLNDTSDRLSNLERGYGQLDTGGSTANGFYVTAFTHTLAGAPMSGYYIQWDPAHMWPKNAASLDGTGTTIILPQANTIYGYRINVRNFTVSNASFQVLAIVNGDFSQDTVAFNSIPYAGGATAMWHGYMVGNMGQSTGVGNYDGPLSISVQVNNTTPGGVAIPIDAGLDITAFGQSWSPDTGGLSGPPTDAVGSPVGGMTAWYDATAIKGVVDGGVVAAWPDRSANHLDLTVLGVSGPGPKLRLSGSSMIKGHPVVDFETVDQHMGSVSATLNNVAPVTIFAVAKSTNTTPTQWIAGYSSGPEVEIASGAYNARDNTNVASWPSADTNAHYITGVITNVSGSNVILRVDGVQRGITAASGPAYALGQLLLGGAPPTRNLFGVIGEVLIYQGINLSVGQWQQNEIYLKNKWGFA